MYFHPGKYDKIKKNFPSDPDNVVANLKLSTKFKTEQVFSLECINKSNFQCRSQNCAILEKLYK